MKKNRITKKTLSIILLAMALFAIFIVPILASAESADDTYAVPAPKEIVQDVEVSSDPEPQTQPFTWVYLASIAGSTAFTLLFVQFFKVPLDKVWKIPTRLFVYIVSLAVMLVATLFTGGLTIDSAALAACNALLAAFAAYGAYEVTFARKDNKT